MKITETHPWQRELSELITDPQELAKLLNLEYQQFDKNVTAAFPLRVTRSYASRIKKGDPNDPLLLQILPVQQELQTFPEFSDNPLQEQNANPIPGLLHKYRDRVLLTPTGACAIHCRYCFRRHFPYSDNMQTNWQQTVNYLAAHPEVKEVILSGGDPLMLKDKPLRDLIEHLASVAHIKRLRIHSRLPIVLPSRITIELITALNSTRLKPVMIVHCNHSNEIDNDVKFAIKKFADAAIPVFNQSVLLRGINDCVTTLVNLSEALFSAGIIPYYLHLLDKVQGAAHFDLAEENAKKLIQEMMAQLPGYLVPRLVRETPRMKSKYLVPVF